MIELRSSSELIGQANGSTPETEHLDETEITKVAKRSLEDLASLGEKVNEANWASPETNHLVKQFPEILSATNPFTSLEVRVFSGANPSGANQFTSFIIPVFVLKGLSPFFKQCFSNALKEKNTNILEWRDLHIQAATQLILFAHLKAKVIERDQYRSLEALKAQFPEDFQDILYDILNFCQGSLIIKLRKECEQFIEKQIEENLSEISTYLKWACNIPSDLKVIEVWESSVLKQAITSEKRIEIYDIFISIAESDFSDCLPGHKNFILRSLQQCFEKMVLKLSNCSDNEREKIYQCLFKIYPRFNMSRSLVKKIVDLSPKDLLQSNESIELKIAFAFLLVSLPTFNKDTISRFLESLSSELRSKETVLLIRATLNLVKDSKDSYGETIQSFSDVININPENIIALNRRGDCFLNKNDVDNAFKDFNRSLELEPNNAFALRGRGECFRRKGEVENALKDFNRSLELEPNNAFALRGRGDCFRLKGDLDSALKDLNRSLELEPDNAFALASRSACFTQKTI